MKIKDTKTDARAMWRSAGSRPPQECRRYADNARRLGRPELVRECLLREAELLPATRKGVHPSTELEHRIVRDMRLIESMSGKVLSRTWGMIPRHGFIGMVERIVTKNEPSTGYDLAVKYGLTQATFEQTVLDNPGLFSQEAIASSRARLARP